MNFEEFDQVFDQFAVSAFRLEALQRYAVDESDEDYLAWRAGRPRPERSVRTEPWLARVARTTVTDGKEWGRVHVVDHPLSEYMRYELVAYQENAAAGEAIRIANRSATPELARLDTDFWLFDAETNQAQVVFIHYDSDGNVTGFASSATRSVLDHCRTMRDLALTHSMDLNTYLATHKESTRQAA